MEKLAMALVFALFALPGIAKAQVGIRIQLNLPVTPPLVVVEPGVQVVEDFDEEVFYTDGWYWVRRDGGWYRARSPRAQFVFVQPRYVPVRIVRIPPGRYKHWRKVEHEAWKEQEKAEHRAWKEDEKAERREMKEREKGERKHGKHRERD